MNWSGETATSVFLIFGLSNIAYFLGGKGKCLLN